MPFSRAFFAGTHRAAVAVSAVCLVLLTALWGIAYERAAHERDEAAHDAVGHSSKVAESARDYYVAAALGSLLIAAFGGALLVTLARQRRSFEAKRRADARYRATFDQAAVGISHHSLDGRFLRANSKLCAMLGYEEQELLSLTFMDVLHPQDAAALADKRKRLSAEAPELQVQVETRIIRKDGKVIWTSASTTFVPGSHGKPEYLLTLAQDITDRKEAEAALKSSEERFRSLTELSSDFYWETDAEHRFTRRGPAGKTSGVDVFLHSRQLGLRRWEIPYLSPDEAGWRVHGAVLDAHQPFRNFEFSRAGGDGRERHISISGDPVFDRGGAFKGYRGVGTDITHRKQAETALKKSEERFRRYFELGLIGMAISDPARGLMEVNDRLCEMLGYTRGELLRANWAQLTHPEDLAVELASYDAVVRGASEGYSLEKRFLRKDGGIVHSRISVRCIRKADGSPECFLALADDVTEQKRQKEKLERDANYDLLTGLPNRALFGDRLTQALAQAKRRRWTAGVLYLNLDRFKVVNGTFGHRWGDEILRQVGQRLQSCVRAGDSVARVGADEFAVALAELAQPTDARLVARKVVDILSRPFEVLGQEVVLSASIGIATEPPDGDSGESLLKHAGVAMARAKEMGRNNIQFYSTGMNERAARDLKLQTELRHALERREFLLHFQPKAAVPSGRIIGFEALLRWQPAGKALVSPADFIPLLEESGLIVPVGAWVLRAACAQIGAWRSAGRRPVPVAINVSAKQFTDDLCEIVRDALQEHRVDAGMLELEITESDAMREPERVIAVLKRLRELGVAVSIDDFGTGYSSLGYLKRFPVQALKLDRSFVTGLPDHPDDVSIAKAVISMAHSLGLKVVAEGVETQAQRDFLADNCCDQMQGYLLSRPLPADQCVAYLDAAVAQAEAA